MIERVERASKHTEIVIVAATCDRCGRELGRVTGVGVDNDFPFRGIAIRGRIYAQSGSADETRALAAELCEPCVKILVGWIDSDDVFDREFTYKRMEGPDG